MFTAIARQFSLWLKPLAKRKPRRTDRRERNRTRLGIDGVVLEARITPALSAVSAGAAFPYTAVVKLRMTYADGSVYVGSGVMVDSFHVLTAGHNLYNSSEGGWVQSISVIPKLNGTSQPYGSASATYVRTYPSFITYNNSNPGSTSTGIKDIGLITLNRKIGNSTSWMSYGYDNNDGRFAAGTIMNTAGYPATAGYTGNTMYSSSGKIAGLSADKAAITYKQSEITTYGGQSGSPVWIYSSSTGKRTVYGIHVGGSGTATSTNFATRITQSIFNDLGSWRSQDAAPAQSAQIQSAAVGGGTTTVHGVGHSLTVGPAKAQAAGLAPVSLSASTPAVAGHAIQSVMVAPAAGSVTLVMDADPTNDGAAKRAEPTPQVAPTTTHREDTLSDMLLVTSVALVA